MKPQIVLAVDTASPIISLALSVNGKVFHVEKDTAKPHDELLWPMLDALFKKAKVDRNKLSAIAASSGPGRFTGIRIGMAFAAVAAGQLKIPALAVSRLEGLAWRLPRGKGCAAIPGWKGERYYQLYTRGAAAPKAVELPAWVDEAMWSKRATELAQAGAQILEAQPDARDLLPPALAALSRARKPKFAPLYLKPASYEKLVR